MLVETSEKAYKRLTKVVSSYTAANEEELSLTLGDIVEVLGDDEKGWCRGRINGKEGVFPSEFVVSIKEEEEPSPYNILSYTNPTPASSKPSKSSNS